MRYLIYSAIVAASAISFAPASQAGGYCVPGFEVNTSQYTVGLGTFFCSKAHIGEPAGETNIRDHRGNTIRDHRSSSNIRDHRDGGSQETQIRDHRNDQRFNPRRDG